jgi:hypothetical protein
MGMFLNTAAIGNFTFQPTAQPAAALMIDSGSNPGKIFDGQGNDFLDPNKILKNVDKFSSSVKPATSNTWTSQLVPPVFFERHADPNKILKTTNSRINQIMSPGFGQGLNFNVPLLPGGIPDLGVNPDATRIALSTLFFSSALQAPPAMNNPANYNPFLWQNPNSLNILLGVQQAHGAIVNGSGSPFISPMPGGFFLLG